MSNDTATLTIGDAARRLGVSIGTLRRWEAQGKISAHRTLGGQRRYTPEDVEAARPKVAS